MNPAQAYIKDVAKDYAGGKATEHTYRPALKAYLQAVLGSGYTPTNEPKRQACGAPDFIIEKGDVPVGFMEAKDVPVNLDKLNKPDQDQQKRYLESLDNLVYTNYLEFRFYRKGVMVGEPIILGQVVKGKVELCLEAVDPLTNALREFASYQTQTITSAKQLASLMAKKAILIKEVFTKILDAGEKSELHEQYAEFKRVLLHEVTHAEFADIYAETIAYGLFTARLHDSTLDTFTRGEAYGLIPRSNPFLRQLFTYVGTNLDDRAVWIVDALCDIFRATDVGELVKKFYRGKARKDPFLHFYEDFLAEYNPAKRKARGVWYTPEPVVSFIVRAVDDVLKTHFNLPDGLADTSKTKISVPEFTASGRKTVMVEREVHRVQILDVATGTGTFLAEVIAQIHAVYASQQGLWSSYVERDLIPRVHGFELLMASYAMCHMKLELLLKETGYKPREKDAPRLNVYLTNSLQGPDGDDTHLPLLSWFSSESKQANEIKRTTPIMVAIGNPPYSGISSNMGDDLIVDIEPYKYVNGVHFGERKHWLHDDYVKFIRLGEYFIDKNGEGVLGYITNHSYLDNPTFRGMRWHLLNTFDDIYVLDLHGNAKKKEVAPDGSADKNVFDIQQGVAIIIGVKSTKRAKNEKKPLATLHHAEVWGSRDGKYAALNDGTLASVAWTKVDYAEPFYFFMPKNTEGQSEYQQGFGVDELFRVNVTGIVTARDGLVIDFDKDELAKRMAHFADSKRSDDEVRADLFGHKKAGKYLAGDSRGWKMTAARKAIAVNNHAAIIKPITYRPFDDRFIYYTPAMVDWGREKFMQKMFLGKNLGMVVSRINRQMSLGYFFCVNKLMDFHMLDNAQDATYTFPLYLYEGTLQPTKTPNLDGHIWEKLKRAGGKVAEEPQAVFDYVYAVLHAPSYRTAYAEFLKSDFPRIPYPASPFQFEAMANLGAELRELHLLEHPACTPPKGMAAYPVDGSHVVDKVRYAEGKVFINETQYFDAVPLVAWEFYIGGYQPAQKWLKDRKGRALTIEDIRHYQRIIATLTRTHEVMGLVDGVYKGV